MVDEKRSRAVHIALSHIKAWTDHDWARTRLLLADDVRASVSTTYPQWRIAEYAGADAYMVPKEKAAQLVEPGSVVILAAVGDDTRALVVATMRMRVGPEGSIATLVRSCLYTVNERGLIQEEMDNFLFLP